MSGFSFLHAADIHLDSGFAGLSAGAPEAAALFAGATRAAFRKLVDAAIDGGVAFVVLAGDLYDGPARDVSAALFVRDQLRRLAEARIEVFLAKGNHDAESQIADVLESPPNLRVFSARRAETLQIDSLRVALHGRSFPERHVAEDFARGYPAAMPGWFNIGVLHTSADGRPPHAVYAPCSVAVLGAYGYDYWALGHVHEAETLCADPPILFPGCLQGRHIREAGPKGAVRVTVEDGRARAEFLALDALRWAPVAVDLSGLSTEAERRAAGRDALRTALAAADGRPVVVRLAWRGATPLDAGLRRAGAAALRDEARALAADLSDALLVEKVEVATLPPAATDPAALGPLAEALAAATADPAARAEIAAAIDEVFGRIRHDPAEGPPPRPDPADVTASARRLLIARGLATPAGEGDA
jgi:DNA repair exonuclease SbcCD nuclease subunit